jgi:hypothetical protein
MLDDGTTNEIEAPSLRSSQLPPEALEREAAMASCIERVDLDEAREEYAEQDQLVIFDGLLEGRVLDELHGALSLVDQLGSRKRIPGYKASSSVSAHTLAAQAPAFMDLYRSRALISFLSSLVEAPLEVCPEGDPHAVALYRYSEPGDRVGFHYDVSHYRGTRYTVLVGLVNDSTSHLHCRLYTRVAERANEDRMVAMDPGKVVIFNGDRLYHAVTPLGPDELRVVLTLQYVTDPHMAPARRLVSNLKDAVTYFGFREWMRQAVSRH